MTRSPPSVHYVFFDFTPEQVLAWGGPAELVVDHPEYQHSVTLSGETVVELSSDLRD